MRKRIVRRNPLSERLGLLLLVIDLWRRLPPKRRRQALTLARRHGPRLAKGALRRRARRAVKSD